MEIKLAKITSRSYKLYENVTLLFYIVATLYHTLYRIVPLKTPMYHPET